MPIARLELPTNTNESTMNNSIIFVHDHQPESGINTFSELFSVVHGRGQSHLLGLLNYGKEGYKTVNLAHPKNKSASSLLKNTLADLEVKKIILPTIRFYMRASLVYRPELP